MMARVVVSISAMVVSIVLVPSATAGTIMQSQHYDFTLMSPGDSSFQEYMGLLFDPFDDQAGTLVLESVTLGFSISASAHATVENDSEFYMMSAVYLTSSVFLGIDNLPVSPASHHEDSPSVFLEPSDGVPDSGPDFYDFGTLLLDAVGFGHWDTFSDFWRFTGSDPVELVFDGRAAFAIGSEERPLLTVSDLTASMDATLTYEYSVVPEPATLSVLALGGSAVMRRKRR